MNNVEVKSVLEAPSGQPKDVLQQGEGVQAGPEALPETGTNATSTDHAIEPTSVEINIDSEVPRSSIAGKNSEDMEASTSGLKTEMVASEILLQLPERELQNLCKLLAKEGYVTTTDVLS